MQTRVCRTLVLAGCLSAVVLGCPRPASSARSDDGAPPSRIPAPKSGPSSHPMPHGSTGTSPNPGLDPRQMLEQRLRHGQMEEPTAQGEVSDRLDRFYRSPESLAGARDRSGPVEQAGR